MQVLVRDNNIDQALRVLKKKMQREGVFREMKRRRFYEKPSEQAAREKSEAMRRIRKLARNPRPGQRETNLEFALLECNQRGEQLLGLRAASFAISIASIAFAGATTAARSW